MLMEHPQADPQAQHITRKRATLKSLTPLPGSVPAAKTGDAPRRMSAPVMAAIGLIVLAAVVGGGWLAMRRPASNEVSSAARQASSPPVSTFPTSSTPTQEESIATATVMRLDMPTLLTRGNEYLAFGEKNFGEKLDFPPGENAIDMFQEVLRRDSSNAQARQGLAKIAAYYEQAARDALKNGLYTATDEFIDKGLRADPRDENLAKLKTQLAQKEKGG